ncbi:double zinc ribbon domain-containing protein [Neorhodopirellula pilleata]|uniref:Competence protein A n=1 Tax=Neorhodopirellula pilleata TaxID=2714738 RepID=A0A5C5ZK15_9BACT|nr:zinc ribbon domain-containing protein [Neorhodopirellula pilleata]TWT87764.1 Competence protein A [Neorhodopirellula pilleata]
MSVSESTSTALQCGACQHANTDSAQFCASCGHSLYEACQTCNGPVTLTQKFCVSCGMDLVAWLNQRIQDQEKRLGEAVAAAKIHEYERSLAILQRIGESKDFRFQKQADTARQAKGKIEQLRDRMLGDATSRIEQAKTLYATGNQAQAVSLLSPVPERLLDDESRQILKSGKMYLDQLGALQSELQEALAAKDYVMASGLVGQLLELQPGNAKYETLATQLGEKLLRRCEKLYARQEYSAASDTLATLPQAARGKAYDKLQQQIETARWLSDQFADEPYATNILGRLAMRFAKEIPSSGQAADLVKQLKEAVKAKRHSRRDASPDWKGSQKTWVGGRVGVLGQIQSLDLSSLEEPIAHFSQYAVALGLAIQGVGRARVDGNLITKKGMFAKIAKGKSKLAWGIDVGSSGVRAVQIQIEKGKDQPILMKCVHVDYSAPINRGGNVRGGGTQEIPAAIKTLLEQIDLTGATVWCNLSSFDAVARFCELPPVKDKDADRLVDLEVRGRIPIDKEDLALVTWRHGFDKESKTGRPLIMAAATKIAVQRRLDLLGTGGLTTIEGLVPEAIALANFAAFEFADLLSPEEPEEDDEDLEANDKKNKGKKGKKEKKESTRSLTSEEKQPTIALIDVGAAKTTMVLVSPISIWYWTQEAGGEDITSIVARETKLTSEKAEQSKRNLSAIECPNRVDDQIEQKQTALRMRLIKLLEEGKNTFRHMDVQQTWCVGQAHLQHGFLRRVLVK